MSAGEWLYGGFWLMLGAMLSWYTVWGGMFTAAYLYGFIKGLFSRW